MKLSYALLIICGCGAGAGNVVASDPVELMYGGHPVTFIPDADSNVCYTSDDRVPLNPTGTVYVQFKEHTPQYDIDELFSKYDLQTLEDRGYGEYLVQKNEGVQELLHTIHKLQEERGIEVAEPEFSTAAIQQHEKPYY